MRVSWRSDGIRERATRNPSASGRAADRRVRQHPAGRRTPCGRAPVRIAHARRPTPVRRRRGRAGVAPRSGTRQRPSSAALAPRTIVGGRRRRAAARSLVRAVDRRGRRSPGSSPSTSITALSADLPDPAELGDALVRPSRRSSTTGPARPSSPGSSRTQRTRRRLPATSRRSCWTRRPTAEDRTFWDERRLRRPRRWSPPRSRRSRATAAAPRRSPSSWSGRGCCPTDVVEPGADVYLRKAKEVIQSARLTQAFPGQTGKQQIITAYLNEIFYGHDAYGIAAAAQVYFGVSDLREADARPGRAARRPPPVAVDARPVPLRRGEQRGPAWSCPRTRRRSSAATGSSPTCRRSRWTQLTPPRSQAAHRGAGRPRAATSRPCSARRTSCGRSARQLEQILGLGRGRRDRRLPGHHDARLAGPAARRAPAWRPRSSRPNLPASPGGALLNRLEDPARRTGAGSAALRGKDLHNAALVAIDYRTGDVRAYVGLRRLLPRRASRAGGSTPSTTRRASGRASRARRSSRSSTRRRSSARR